MLAEAALRRLAVAAKSKTGGAKKEGRREGVLSGAGKRRGRGEDMFGDMLREIASDDAEGTEIGADGTNEMGEENIGLGMGVEDGLVVNWDTGSWRRGGGRRV